MAPAGFEQSQQVRSHRNRQVILYLLEQIYCAHITSIKAHHIRRDGQLFSLAAEYISLIVQAAVNFVHVSLQCLLLLSFGCLKTKPGDQSKRSSTPIGNPSCTRVVRNTWSPSRRQRFLYILFFCHNVWNREWHMCHSLAMCSHTW
jgi:hypothetical protein